MQTLPSITYVEKESKIVFECVSIIPACACKRNGIFPPSNFQQQRAESFSAFYQVNLKDFPVLGLSSLIIFITPLCCWQSEHDLGSFETSSEILPKK